MKDIFKYPNNSGTNYIDPNYIGDDTVGFQKRIKEMIDGTYKTHLNSTSKGTVNNTINHIGRFHDVPELEEASGNNTIYKFWEQPLIDFEMQSKMPHVKDISVDLDSVTHSGTTYLIPKLRVEFKKAHGFSSGDRLKLTRGITTSGWEHYYGGSLTDFLYAQVINTTEIHLSHHQNPSNTPPVLNNYVLSRLDNTIYDITSFGRDEGAENTGNETAQVMRGGPNGDSGAALLRLKQVGGGVGLALNSNVRLKTTFNDGTHTTGSGTANQTGVTYFLKPHTYDDTTTSFEMYTDSDLTTPATINEPLICTATKTYTSAGTFTLQGQTWTDWGVSTANKDKLVDEAFGYARVYATVTNGTFTGKSASPKTIGTGRSFQQDFFIEPGGLTFNVKDKNDFAGTGHTNQDFILADAGSGVDVTITIEFIETGRTDGGWYRYLSNATTDEDMIIGKHDDTETLEVKQALIYNPGNTAYKKQTGASTFVAGAKYKGTAYTNYGTTGETLKNINDYATSFGHPALTMPADSTINVNSDGYITGFTFPGTYDETDRGTFYTIPDTQSLIENPNRTPQHIYMPIVKADDTYSAPALTLAEQEDVFDMDTEWDTNAFGDGTRHWPDHVRPVSAIWTYNQPSQTSVSQNGTKYVRNFGHTNWQLEVTYPPMLNNDFRKFHSAVQKAKGQFVPFYFNISEGSDHWLFGFNQLTAPNPTRVKNISGNHVLVEGHTHNFGPVPEGSLIIAGANNNGQIHTITNETSANIFGEINHRFAYAPTSGLSNGHQVYYRPIHLVVTLSEDNFEYTKDTAGRYQFTVKFDLDEFK
jgi:hypothetical protein